MRKTLSILALLGLTACCVVGCGKKDEDIAPAPGATKSDTPATGAPAERAKATNAPEIGTNPNYSAPAMGSKAK